MSQTTTQSASHPTLTQRIDAWWLTSLLILVGGLFAVAYLTWAAVIGVNYEWGPYVSPIYSTPFIPSWWKLSPAFILLWIPAGFRLTCYYGRKAYYRAAFADPAECAVEEPYRKSFKGETAFPFVMQNLHRYFLYFALALTGLHWFEFFQSVWHGGAIYFGVGTVILLLDTLALSMYVFSCHSFRHMIGGKGRCFTCQKFGKAKFKVWAKVTILNEFHGKWFWISLYSIIIADLYVRLLSMGIIPFDPHFTIF
ncbi:MAG: succinate dehydrogenase [bacterium]